MISHCEVMQENFVSLLEANVQRYGDRIALVWGKGSLTWTELEGRASAFARFLSEGGVKGGDRVAMLLPNQWTFPVALMGILKLGALAAPFTPGLKKEEIDLILDDLGPKRTVEEVTLNEGSRVSARPTNSPALIVYTSGSTGWPKGAVFTHRALTSGVLMWANPVLGLTPDDVVLGVLPLGHNYGMYSGLLAPLLSGATVVLVEHFTPEGVLEAIERHRVTVFPAVSTMFRRLLSSAAFPGSDLSSLRLSVSGAAPCPPELCRDWQEKTGVRILRGYGSTEVPRPISYLAEDSTDCSDAVGRAVPGVEVRVADETGKALSCGEVGELWIQSPTAMEGYLDAPATTMAVLADGWFKTGDLASVSGDGLIRIVGRKRDRILRGGFSVFPQEVEVILHSHPAVTEAAVVGMPSLDLGEEVTAFVTLKPKIEIAAGDLIDYCKDRLAHFKYPRRISILDELPKGATGKVLKGELVKKHL